MRPDDTVRLLVGGLRFEGWKRVSVRRGVEQCAGAWSLGVSELWHGQEAGSRIRPGESCQVLIGDEVVCTGYVDAVQIEIEAGTHSVEIIGRDATADLVDCSAVSASGRPGQWRGQTVQAIAADLCAPFKVPVHSEVDTGKPLTSFALQEGETVFEALERAARMRALLLLSNGLGALLITRAGARRAPTALVLGQNMLSARVAQDMRDRFSVYTFKGQAPGSDFFSGPAVSQMRAIARDPDVTRYRPMVVTHDAPDLAATLADRANWEANVRAARGTDAEVKVQGWRHAEGLWQPNTLVRVQGDALRLDDDLLIRSVLFELDEAGSRCTLGLTRADAFTELPLKNQAGTARFWDLPKAVGAS